MACPETRKCRSSTVLAISQLAEMRAQRNGSEGDGIKLKLRTIADEKHQAEQTRTRSDQLVCAGNHMPVAIAQHSQCRQQPGSQSLVKRRT